MLNWQETRWERSQYNRTVTVIDVGHGKQPATILTLGLLRGVKLQIIRVQQFMPTTEKELCTAIKKYTPVADQEFMLCMQDEVVPMDTPETAIKPILLNCTRHQFYHRMMNKESQAFVHGPLEAFDLPGFMFQPLVAFSEWSQNNASGALSDHPLDFGSLRKRLHCEWVDDCVQREKAAVDRLLEPEWRFAGVVQW